MKYWLIARKSLDRFWIESIFKSMLVLLIFLMMIVQEKVLLELRLDIERARLIQFERYKEIPTITHNSQLTPALIKQFCHLDKETTTLLRKASEYFHYSGRTIHKYIKIARTIADLEGEPSIKIHHMKKSLLSQRFRKG